MDIENIKYLFTNIGGGWVYIHDLFIITKDDKIYHTEKFDDDDLLGCEPEYVCDLYPKDLENCWISTSVAFDGTEINKYLFDLLNSEDKVDFEDFKQLEYACMDGTDLTLYKNVDNRLEKLVEYGDIDFMPAVRYVMVLWSSSITK